jgi:hypothetical protein
MATTETKTESKPTHVWVLNNEERQRGIQLPGTYNDVSRTLTPGGILRIIPGWNVLDLVQWETAKLNPTVKVLLEETIPHMAAPEHNAEKSGQVFLEEGPAIENKLDPLAVIEERQCRRMIGEIFDTRLLKQCIDVEKRQVVAQMLRDAYDKIERAASTRKRAS